MKSIIFFLFISSIAFGQNWQQLNPPVTNYYQIGISENQEVYAIGSEGLFGGNYLYRSLDFGINWTLIDSFYFWTNDMQFNQQGLGFVLGGIPSCGLIPGILPVHHQGQISQISNFVSWNSCSASSDVSFLSNNENIFAYSSKYLFSSSDSGHTLTPIYTCLLSYFSHIDRFENTRNNTLFMIAKTYYPSYTDYIIKANHQGQTISLDSFPNDTLLDIRFLANNLGYVLATNKILKTTDAGNQWQSISLPFTARIFDFVNQNTGYIIDVNGVVWETADGGQSWTLSLTGHSINDIYCTGNSVFICGNNGIIFKRTIPNEEPNSTFSPHDLAIKIYPNPSTNVLNIEINNETMQNFTIENALGQTVYIDNMTSEKMISIDDFVSGMYFLKIANQKSVPFVVSK
jgi:Secretion system C-terminal sorting domain